LQPQPHGKQTYLPPACHTLLKFEKLSFCRRMQGVKVPQGYSSNIKSLVSMQDLKRMGLKCHDCHVLMQDLLPVAIRRVLPKNIRQVITRLFIFFNSICKKFIDSNSLHVRQLEMYFPPSFFDITIHLVIHLVREISVEPSGVQALKNPNPLKDDERLVVLVLLSCPFR